MPTTSPLTDPLGISSPHPPHVVCMSVRKAYQYTLLRYQGCLYTHTHIDICMCDDVHSCICVCPASCCRPTGLQSMVPNDEQCYCQQHPHLPIPWVSPLHILQCTLLGTGHTFCNVPQSTLCRAPPTDSLHSDKKQIKRSTLW